MFSDFPGWWEALSTLAKIYWIVAFPSTLLFIIQLIMTFVGGDADSDYDVDHDGDFDADGGGFHIFTFRNMVAFFTLFAWSGLACIEGGLTVALVVIISVVSGSAMMVVMASLFYFISKFSHDGTMSFENAIGEQGDVYMRVPAKKQGLGKVQINVEGTIRTLNAMTEDVEEIKRGTLVQVVDLIGENILLVKRLR